MGIYSDMHYGWGAVFIMTAFISFLGFLLENIWLTARKGYMDNRNMNAPFLLGYGIAVMGFYFVLGTPSDPRIFGETTGSGPKSSFGAYFLLTFVLVSVGEIVLGKTIEKCSGVILWDYTRLPLHITRYTSVFTSLGFTVIIVTFMDCFFERIMDKLCEIEPLRAEIYGGILMTIMVTDFLYNAARTIHTHSITTTWRIDFRTKSIYRYKHNEQ